MNKCLANEQIQTCFLGRGSVYGLDICDLTIKDV